MLALAGLPVNFRSTSSLVIAMNDEAQWMINNNPTSGRALPDFNDNIDTEGLEEVKPKAVNIR